MRQSDRIFANSIHSSGEALRIGWLLLNQIKRFSELCSNASSINIVCDTVLRMYVSVALMKILTNFRKTEEIGVDTRLLALMDIPTASS